MTDHLPWNHPDNQDEDGRFRYGSRGPMPCQRSGCGHDVVRHLSALENGRCTKCYCPTFMRVDESFDQGEEYVMFSLDVELPAWRIEELKHLFPTLVFFEYTHLPPKLINASEPFYILAYNLANQNSGVGVNGRMQVELALQKILEAKDCAVRAAL